ncbi:hypothetical protein LOTGIDRAFT_153603 [Lottia gigantea]|uniref:Uncharacterized protein n=1 Tax=Lottia gigantea TaxID=225164 RepID=V4A378_LOTGI|nr:hypothetical protein LOTGIDRAFT_153603 [Lottia gigantea]ESO91172.1 hypothetical protein LOTGIDRAFT_153603 [Lottia gigantea]
MADIDVNKYLATGQDDAPVNEVVQKFDNISQEENIDTSNYSTQKYTYFDFDDSLKKDQKTSLQAAFQKFRKDRQLLTGWQTFNLLSPPEDKGKDVHKVRESSLNDIPAAPFTTLFSAPLTTGRLYHPVYYGRLFLPGLLFKDYQQQWTLGLLKCQFIGVL